MLLIKVIFAITAASLLTLALYSSLKCGGGGGGGGEGVGCGGGWVVWGDISV